MYAAYVPWCFICLISLPTGISIFEILSTVYTAVTFHELFKEAAMNANSKLDFGVEWQEIFTVLQSEVGTYNMIRISIICGPIDPTFICLSLKCIVWNRL